MICFFFFFNDTATTEIYTLSLHDALPISTMRMPGMAPMFGNVSSPRQTGPGRYEFDADFSMAGDRKSTRLNSSHGYISYAVFCLKKKKKKKKTTYGIYIMTVYIATSTSSI